MGKPTNIASTSHAQAAEFAALAGVATQPGDVTTLKNALRDALAKQTELSSQLDSAFDTHNAMVESANGQIAALQAELAAEKEAHAATAAALEAATTVKTEEQPAA